jgi:predicted DNA-binding transcriptional regulator YafY
LSCGCSGRFVGPNVAIIREAIDPDGWLRIELTFQDLRHAEWALWQLGTRAEILSPPELRQALHQQAVEVATRYASQPDDPKLGPTGNQDRNPGHP